MVGRAGQGRADKQRFRRLAGYIPYLPDFLKSAIEDLFWFCEVTVTVTGLRYLVLLGICTYRKVQYLVSGPADMRDWGSSGKVRYEYSVLNCSSYCHESCLVMGDRVCRCPASFKGTLVRDSYLQVPDVFAVFSVLGMSLPVPLMIEDHYLYCVELRYVVLYGIAWPRSRRSKVHVL